MENYRRLEFVEKVAKAEVAERVKIPEKLEKVADNCEFAQTHCKSMGKIAVKRT